MKPTSSKQVVIAKMNEPIEVRFHMWSNRQATECGIAIARLVCQQPRGDGGFHSVAVYGSTISVIGDVIDRSIAKRVVRDARRCTTCGRQRCLCGQPTRKPAQAETATAPDRKPPSASSSSSFVPPSAVWSLLTAACVLGLGLGLLLAIATDKGQTGVDLRTALATIWQGLTGLGFGLVGIGVMGETQQETLISRIKKLLALSQNNPNENEAALAASRALGLLQEHGLSMAQIDATRDKDSKPASDAQSAKREKTASKKSAMYKYQRDLMEALAGLFFCFHWIDETTKEDPRAKYGTRKVKTHILLGREDNVVGCQLTYEYLTDTMDRLLPWQGMEKRGKDALLWLAGCTERLVERLETAKQEKVRAQEEATTASQQTGPQTAGLIRLSDLYSSEADLNTDARWGYTPGTTARERAKREADARAMRAKEDELVANGTCSRDDAWYVARGYNVPSKTAVETVPKEEKKETDKQRQKREERKAREEAREEERYERRKTAERAKRNTPAFRQGQRTAEEIGLDSQVAGGSGSTERKAL